jgi:N-acetylmuramoyl-L-alanine amidase
MDYFEHRRLYTGGYNRTGFWYGVYEHKKTTATKELQRRLNIVLGRKSLIVDGDYGPATTKAVRIFQRRYDRLVTGVVDHSTWMVIIKHATQQHTAIQNYKHNLLNLGKQKFVIFVDAGHGGLDSNLKYTTSGKRAYHKGVEMHHQGHYYEGHENRIAAEAFIRACAKRGINCIRTYHPTKDWPLGKRTQIIRDWLERGYYGYLHSFHSNAISERHGAVKLDQTRGFMVFTTKGESLSDELAEQHFKNVQKTTLWQWKYRADESDGDKDYEANFQALRETDLSQYSPHFAAMLEEWGFHSSKTDAQYITSEKGRAQRVEAALKTAKWAQSNLFKHLQ